MPLSKRQTLTQYLIEQRKRFPQASGELNALILDVSIACKAIARAVAFGELAESPPPATRAATSTCRARCRRSSTW
jgi:fructose-1,6-bisphosphatase I/sedoheptulose-1,7-bisphosphatase